MSSTSSIYAASRLVDEATVAQVPCQVCSLADAIAHDFSYVPAQPRKIEVLALKYPALSGSWGQAPPQQTQEGEVPLHREGRPVVTWPLPPDLQRGMCVLKPHGNPPDRTGRAH